MAWRIQWLLSCDHCKRKATFVGQPSSAVEKKARANGWTIRPDEWGVIRHHCPDCKGQVRDRETLCAACGYPNDANGICTRSGCCNSE